MIKLNLMFMLLSLNVFFPALASATDWQVIYQTDFSSDPCWTTNNPNHYYWHASEKAYLMHVSRTANPYEYTYIPVPIHGSFRLEYDVKPIYFPWAGDLHLGLWNEDMMSGSAYPRILGGWTNPDEGPGIRLSHTNIEGLTEGEELHVPNAWELNVWHHGVLTYDEANTTISFTSYRKSDGQNYFSISHSNVGAFFPSSMHNLGTSTQEMVPYPGVYAEGYFDNVVVSVPEPTEPNIVVSPLSHDFGDVELGTSSTLVVTISNVGNSDLTVSGIALETDFAITSAPAPAIVVEPTETKDVEITYTPSALGYNSAVLKITSDDPDEPIVEVQLSAVGIEIPLPPSEQIASILTFFDTSVDGGTLLGDGPGNLAEKRLNALRNMLEAAGDLIEDDFFEEACRQLADAYRRMDGQPQPPDFVKGEAVPELAGMLEELMTTLGCE